MSAKLTEARHEARAERDAWLSDPEAQYEAGLAEGRAWGEQDVREQGGMTTYWLTEFRTEAETCRTRGARARQLGVLRGYRESVRTQHGGRWGT
jgi:hypothetical protein